MYCGACAHDATLLRGLLKRGHDVTIIPLYTPLKIDADGALPATHVFMGGINAYLQQNLGFFRHTPGFLDRLFDSPALLRWASSFAVKTDPADLGPMTVSVLQGKDGRQRKELEKLLEFIESGPRPDMVSITNSLLSAVAPVVKERLGVPVACLLQGEDSFVEGMVEPYRTQARDLMRRNAEFIDLFLAPSKAHAEKMEEFLAVSPAKLKLVRLGIDAEAFAGDRHSPGKPFRIGYLSVINPSKGLDMLVDAFIGLAEQRDDVVLRVVGRVLDKRYFREQIEKIERTGLSARFEHLGEVAFDDKVRFLHECDVYCQPSRIAESRGVASLEAMAAGLPVVVPESGIYPELLELTSGGYAFTPRSTESLIARLREVLNDPDDARTVGARAAEGVRKHFSAERMVEETEAAYLALVERGAGR